MDIYTQLKQFHPKGNAERTAQKQILKDWELYGDALLDRQSPAHLTASALIMDSSLTEVLMVHHNLFKTWTWVGGHTEPGEDLLAAALREAREETGVEQIQPMTGQLLALDILSVPDHVKNDRLVTGHIHYSAAFGLIAPKTQAPKSKADENSAAAWIPISQLPDYCTEPHMLPIYKKIYTRMKSIIQIRDNALSQLPFALLPWYRENARKLPWRTDNAPYHVWLSEIMLQQTRVEAVRGYYLRFLASFPTIADLANAEESQVMKHWEGLGYYSRARNLQKAAKQIMAEFGGHFPTEYTSIRALPGIGDYTAGAIASICFEQPEPAVDGNVIRVISRICALYLLPEQLKKQLVPMLRTIYPAGQCGDFTQSLMELGATVCVPKDKPKCELCPAKDFCLAHCSGTEQHLPLKAEKKPRKIEDRTVFCLTCKDKIAVLPRPQKGLLAGLWELPNVSDTLDAAAALSLAEVWGVSPRELIKSVFRIHVFTHIEWHMTCYYLECSRQTKKFVWVKKEQLDSEITLPTAFKLFLN